MSAKHLSANTFGRNPRLMPYLLEHCGEHPAQRGLREEIERSERAIMSGSPDEGAFFAWLMPLLGCKKVIEIGVFRGATTLALALALPADGKVVGLDVSDDFASTGKKYWKEAGVQDKIDLRIGDAVASLDKMIADGEAGSYDFAFIDADKVSYPKYWESCLKLLKPGKGVIAVDNCLWGGSVHPLAEDADEDTKTLSKLNETIKNDKRVQACMLGIADGIYFARKL